MKNDFFSNNKVVFIPNKLHARIKRFKKKHRCESFGHALEILLKELK